MKKSHPDVVRKSGGAPLPFRGGGIYQAKVTSAGNGNTVRIRIPGLGVHVANVSALDITEAKRLAAGDSVICGFLENDNQQLIVFGRSNVVPDVFATKVELAAQVTQLQAQITALSAALTALTNRYNSHVAHPPPA